MPSLREEIKQTRPFKSLYEETLLNLVRTSEVLSARTEDALKEHGITGTQYNVLRILRGAGPAGLACGAIGERMLTRESDMTRLIDRMLALKLVERTRHEGDRRVVVTTLTEKGRQLLTTLDPVVKEVQRRLLGHMEEASLKQLIGLLEQARERAGLRTED
jgi:DNA-binding MarR family transcriptional regulator